MAGLSEGIVFHKLQGRNVDTGGMLTVCVVNKMYPYLGYISCVRASIASLLDA